MAKVYLTSLLGAINTQFDAIFLKVQGFGAFEYFVLDLIVLFVVYRVLVWGMGRGKIGKGTKGRGADTGLLKDIEQGFNGVQEKIGGNKPKVPQINNAEINVANKVEGLIKKVKEMQEMCSGYQADVIDAHIQVFSVLKGDEGGNFLQLPERELVEPDSALPPLEENEEGLI